MPSKRSPSQRTAEARQGRQMAAQTLGGNAGRLISASRRNSSDPSRPASTPTDLEGYASTLFAHDRFPLSGTTTSLVLTFLPIANSQHVYLNGLEMDEGFEYTLSGTILTFPAIAGLAAGDVVDVRYAYDDLTSGGILVPFGATGWKYKIIGISDATDYSATSYVDTSWTVGQAGFGTGYPEYGTTTSWPLDGRIWLRRLITTVSGVDVTIRGRSDNYADVYWNGTLVYSKGFGGAADIWTVTVAGTGSDLLAIRATDDPPTAGDSCFIDAQVSQ